MNIKQKTMPQLTKILKEEYVIIESRVGPDARGPVKCLNCQQAFEPGERWQRVTAPADPVLGTYSIGTHSKCPGRIRAQAA